MFTGIIEATGRVVELIQEEGNLHIWISSPLSDGLKVDQSVAHQGVCLTVTHLKPGMHRVTAVAETLNKTNLGSLKLQQKVNLERCMPAHGRFDGHIVQGHVDCTARCTRVEENNGSWLYYFEMPADADMGLIVDKGSITINGVSLTVVKTTDRGFHVTIIPFTFEHTTFSELQAGSDVNIEYDILGKYIRKQLAFLHS